MCIKEVGALHAVTENFKFRDILFHNFSELTLLVNFIFMRHEQKKT